MTQLRLVTSREAFPDQRVALFDALQCEQMSNSGLTAATEAAAACLEG
jgi:phage/plasmid primase-like uncharacterized protein